MYGRAQDRVASGRGWGVYREQGRTLLVFFVCYLADELLDAVKLCDRALHCVEGHARDPLRQCQVGDLQAAAVTQRVRCR